MLMQVWGGKCVPYLSFLEYFLACKVFDGVELCGVVGEVTGGRQLEVEGAGLLPSPSVLGKQILSTQSILTRSNLKAGCT